MARSTDRHEKPQRILVAMSGGVDSAVAAYILKRAGHDVIGATMKLFCFDREESARRPCCDMEAIRLARRTAGIMQIPHVVIDLEESFRREVINDFISEYAAARTPNPCIRCNTFVKFAPLLTKARRMGCDAIATGHYVRLVRSTDDDGWGLYRARDSNKDQSYVLWGLEHEQLGSFHFPLGSTLKSVVRRLARRLGLGAADRAESQDICFVPTGRHEEFLTEQIDPGHPMRRPGPIRKADGEQIGEHDGLLGYTIGQRRGTAVGYGDRLYVIRLDPETATLWVGSKKETASSGLVASGGNLLAPVSDLTGDGVTAQIRYRHRGAACRVTAGDAGKWNVRFSEPAEGVTPGQSVVFYKDDRMLAGGVIESPLPIASPEPPA